VPGLPGARCGARSGTTGPRSRRRPCRWPASWAGGQDLLGSDFPNIPYPYARQLTGLARLGLGEDWLRAVCWDNPVALFGAPG